MKRTASLGACALLLLSSAAYADMSQQEQSHKGQKRQGQQGGQLSQESKPKGKHQPGSLDMTGTRDATPGEYAVLPLARGEKKEVRQHELIGDEVKSKDGQKIGSLEQLIMDTRTGKIEYGVVNFADTNEKWPILWNSFKVDREGQVTLNLTREQIKSSHGSIDQAQDLSPDIKKLMKDMQGQMGKPVTGGLGVQKAPAAGGGQGEDQAATSGPSGPRGGPISGSGDAPQFEGEGQKGEGQQQGQHQ